MDKYVIQVLMHNHSDWHNVISEEWEQVAVQDASYWQYRSDSVKLGYKYRVVHYQQGKKQGCIVWPGVPTQASFIEGVVNA